jgi:hypothetical protein
LGYLNVTDQLGKTSIALDPARSYFIQRLFTEYTKGTSSMAELRRKSKDWGLLSRKQQTLSGSRYQRPSAAPMSGKSGSRGIFSR